MVIEPNGWYTQDCAVPSRGRPPAALSRPILVSLCGTFGLVVRPPQSLLEHSPTHVLTMADAKYFSTTKKGTLLLTQRRKRMTKSTN